MLTRVSLLFCPIKAFDRARLAGPQGTLPDLLEIVADLLLNSANDGSCNSSASRFLNNRLLGFAFVNCAVYNYKDAARKSPSSDASYTDLLMSMFVLQEEKSENDSSLQGAVNRTYVIIHTQSAGVGVAAVQM